MPKVTFVAHDGARIIADVSEGTSVMRAAIDNRVAGIEGDCGGSCACATCHVHVASEWLDRITAAKSNELDLLEFAPERDAFSRLGCQITMTAALDGLVVTVPKSQL